MWGGVQGKVLEGKLPRQGCPWVLEVFPALSSRYGQGSLAPGTGHLLYAAKSQAASFKSLSLLSTTQSQRGGSSSPPVLPLYPVPHPQACALRFSFPISQGAALALGLDGVRCWASEPLNFLPTGTDTRPADNAPTWVHAGHSLSSR